MTFQHNCRPGHNTSLRDGATAADRLGRILEAVDDTTTKLHVPRQKWSRIAHQQCHVSIPETGKNLTEPDRGNEEGDEEFAT